MGERADGPWTIAELELAIKKVRGVVSARVVASAENAIEEIHVLTDDNRIPKQVVRDIESAILVQLGIALDHKKISVAQLSTNSSVLQPLSPGNRLKLVAVNVWSNRLDTEVKVEVEAGAKCFTGTASGPALTARRGPLVVEAVLRAVEASLAKGYVRFGVEDLQFLNFAGGEVALVCIGMASAIGEDRLLGSSFVRLDRWEASARATLAAINRRLSALLEISDHY